MFNKILKLSNGDTVIADISEETKTYIDLMRPIKILSVQKQDGNLQVLFMRWDHAMDFEKPVRVFKSAIVSVGEPTNEYIKSYKDIYEDYENKDDVSEETEMISFEDTKKDKDLNENLDDIMRLMMEMSSKSKDTLH